MFYRHVINPPDRLALAGDEVGVWLVDMGPAGAAGPWTLIGEERLRLRSFQNPAAARTFGAGRTALRALLGRYLGRPAAAVDLVSGPHGKPALAGDAPALAFNLSHAGDTLLVALALGNDQRVDLGVDLERAPAPEGFRDVARSYFAAAEARGLDALPDAEAGARFLRLWTRKEAVVKAAGLGMSLPPDRVRVSHGAGDARILDLPPDQGVLSDWSLHDLSPNGDLVAALALRGAPEARPVGYVCSLDELI